MLSNDRPDLSKQLKGLNVYLIGMMGSGKSTLGHHVAKALGYRFLDTDILIEKAAGQAISKIFAESGETAFRQLETQILGQVSSYKKMVVATGGGIVVERQNWNFLHYGVTVWLDVPVNVLYRRLKSDRNRPLLQTDDPQKTLQTILNQRKHLYDQADVHVSITKNDAAEQVAQRILTAIQGAIKPEPLPPEPGEFELRYDPNFFPKSDS
ncbi:MAG: shikimate kinase [Cyanobacteria bacterium P01_F01_bin.150]